MEQKRRIVPPVYLLLTLIAMIGFHFGLPLIQIISAPISYSGIALAVLGFWVTVSSAIAFRKAGTPVRPFETSTALVTSGFFRFTRNPMYLGMVVFLIGVGLFFGSLGSLIPIPPFVWIISTKFIHGEENFMEEIFGAKYLAYKRRVRRWL